MPMRNCTTLDGISDLQLLIVELEKSQPNSKVIKSLTAKYGIPYKLDISEQLDELLTFLNSLPMSSELNSNKEI